MHKYINYHCIMSQATGMMLDEHEMPQAYSSSSHQNQGNSKLRSLYSTVLMFVIIHIQAHAEKRQASVRYCLLRETTLYSLFLDTKSPTEIDYPCYPLEVLDKHHY